ncbi:hypothetical protein [Nocardioides nanhaiensis]|uniref:DUF2530 domain-containing protein n=1 Tax=Nocardioides nanhaiensis TaxID=1476871 RepID=A0ABP8WGW4_9ACTN
MASPGSADPRTARALSILLVVVGIVLVITHFVLDAGDGEAPRWIIYAAVVSALAGAAVAGTTYGRRR